MTHFLTININFLRGKTRRAGFRISLCLLFGGVFVASCEDDPVPRDYPRVRTLEVTSITEEGATFTAEIYEEGSVPITEHGFAWSYFKPDVNSSEKVFLGSFEGTGSFKTDILTALTTDGVYRVSAFVKAGDYTVYGNEVTFTSLGSSGPVITGFEPSSVRCGDTVVVRGRNFSYVSNKTFIDDILTYNSTLSDSVLKIVVPYSLTKKENIISVEVAGNRSHYTADKLWVNIPEIASISPQQAYWGDTLLLEILNLRSNNLLSVALGSIALTPVEPYDGSSLRIIVPATLASTETPIQINIPERTIVSSTPFSLLPPVIDSISPLKGNWSSIVTLYGHFNPTLTGTSVKFGELAATIQSLTRDSIQVKVPATLTVASNLVYKYGTFQCTSPKQFSFLLPEIISISPMSDYAGGIVTITGNNFSPSNTSVRFNELAGKIISVSNNEVRCNVPGGYNGNAVITLTSGTNTYVNQDPFLMTNPLVTSFYPSEGTVGDTITIDCKDYNSLTNFVIVTGTGNYNLGKINANNNIIKAVIPSNANTSGYPGATVSRNSVISVISSDEIFTINKPGINSFSPLSGIGGVEVTVLGSNFSPVAGYNRVTINGSYATITFSNRNEIRFIVPAFNIGGDYAITVTVGGMNVTSSEKFSYTSPWSQLPSLPFTCSYGTIMKFGNDVILAHGSTLNKLLYRFDPVSGTFSSINSQTYAFPFIWPSVIEKGNTAYLFGLNNGVAHFYTFDYGSMTLNKESDYPGQVFGDHIFLDGDSVLYMGGGYTKGTNTYNREFWKYSLQSGTWTRLNDLPGYTCHTNEFTVDNRNYIVSTDRSTFEYDPINDTWIQRAQYLGYWSRFKVAVECGGMIYMGYGDNSEETSLKRYDPVRDEWGNLGYTGQPRVSFYLNFSLDGKVYIGGGYNQKAMWRFDPEYNP